MSQKSSWPVMSLRMPSEMMQQLIDAAHGLGLKRSELARRFIGEGLADPDVSLAPPTCEAADKVAELVEDDPHLERLLAPHLEALRLVEMNRNGNPLQAAARMNDIGRNIARIVIDSKPVRGDTASGPAGSASARAKVLNYVAAAS
ncbi:MAG: hypothetical protein OXM88_09265 [bacterium]|nr:hypothetical protein [bacterium]